MRNLKIFILICLVILFLPKTYCLENTTIYANISNGSLTNSGKFNYSPSSLGLNFSYATANLNTLVNSGCYGINFWYYQSITTNNTYTLQLNFNDYDLYSKFDSSFVKIYVYNGDDVNQASVISVTKSNKATNYKTATIKFISANVGTIIFVELQKEGDDSFFIKFLGPDNFRLNNVKIDSSQSEGNDLIINNATNNTQNIINNDNQNTQNIINNDNQNTQDIINNQNQNTQDIINSNKACKQYDKTNIDIDNKYLKSDDTYGNSNNYGITNYIKIDSNSTIKVLTSLNSDDAKYCFYNVNKELISCGNISNSLVNTNLTIPNNSNYFRSSIQKAQNKPTFEICSNGNQALVDTQQETNDILTDDDIGDSASDMGDFLNGFSTNTFGLTSIVTAPLNLIQSLTSKSCSKLDLPLPYLNNKKIELPCMTPIYQSTFGSLFTMYQTITFGIIAYWVCVRIFNMVKDFKNPEHDEIEVVDL